MNRAITTALRLGHAPCRPVQAHQFGTGWRLPGWAGRLHGRWTDRSRKWTAVERTRVASDDVRKQGVGRKARAMAGDAAHVPVSRPGYAASARLAVESIRTRMASRPGNRPLTSGRLDPAIAGIDSSAASVAPDQGNSMLAADQEASVSRRNGRTGRSLFFHSATHAFTASS
jgi:hypothetical protein